MRGETEKIISNGARKYVLAIIIIIIAAGGWKFYRIHYPKVLKVDVPEAKDFQYFVDEGVEQDLIIEDIIKEKKYLIVDKPIEEISVPEKLVEIIAVEETDVTSINLAIPFTSQAPTANWDQPFQDACEEATILMAVYYYQNKKMPSKAEVEDILIDMVDWQGEFMNGTYDIDIKETGELTKGFFDYNTKLIPDLTADKIRDLLREGIPVIVPANGKLLDNPNFRNGGPHYHMLVIKGFVDDKFITHDPGTRNGADFIYTEANLMVAIADFDHKKSQATGLKIGLILFEN